MKKHYLTPTVDSCTVIQERRFLDSAIKDYNEVMIFEDEEWEEEAPKP